MTHEQAARQAAAVSFEEGCTSQWSLLPMAVDAVREQLETGTFDALRDRSLLFGGIGASFAATGTPLYELRQGGIRAYRTDCADVPEGAPLLADAYVAVSQSGRSRETNQLLLTAPGVFSVAVTNSANGPLRDVSDAALSVGDFRDSRVSSIGFTATLVALGMMADHIVHGEPDRRWEDAVAALPDVLADADDALSRFASELAEGSQVDVVAEAPQVTSCEQAALLFREGPRVASTSMTTRSYLHGPMDAAGPGTSHIVIGRGRESDLARQLQEQSQRILFISGPDVTSPVPVVRVPGGFSFSQRALMEVVLLQRLVSLVGTAKGEDVDGTVFQRLDTKVDSIAEVRESRV